MNEALPFENFLAIKRLELWHFNSRYERLHCMSPEQFPLALTKVQWDDQVRHFT